MEVILNSDIAKLVLGYLKEQNLNNVYHKFCKSSKYLQEEYELLKKGYSPVSYLAISLVDLVKEYSEMKSAINQFFESLPMDVRSNIQCNQWNMKMKIDFILLTSETEIFSNQKYKRGDFEIPQRRVCVPEKRKRSNSLNSNTSFDSVSTIVDNGPTFVTPYSTVKKFKPNTSLNFTFLDTDRRHSGGVVKDGMSQEYQQSKQDAYQTENNENIVDCETEFDLGPENVKVGDHENYNSADGVIITETLLENSDFHNKLSETINKVLNNTQPAAGSQFSAQHHSTPETSGTTDKGQGGLQFQLDEAIKNILEATEQDPIFEQIVDNVLLTKTTCNRSTLSTSGVVLEPNQSVDGSKVAGMTAKTSTPTVTVESKPPPPAQELPENLLDTKATQTQKITKTPRNRRKKIEVLSNKTIVHQTTAKTTGHPQLLTTAYPTHLNIDHPQNVIVQAAQQQQQFSSPRPTQFILINSTGGTVDQTGLQQTNLATFPYYLTPTMNIQDRIPIVSFASPYRSTLNRIVSNGTDPIVVTEMNPNTAVLTSSTMTQPTIVVSNITSTPNLRSILPNGPISPDAELRPCDECIDGKVIATESTEVVIESEPIVIPTNNNEDENTTNIVEKASTPHQIPNLLRIKSNSTPRRRSHIRILDFETPGHSVGENGEDNPRYHHPKTPNTIERSINVRTPLSTRLNLTRKPSLAMRTIKEELMSSDVNEIQPTTVVVEESNEIDIVTVEESTKTVSKITATPRVKKSAKKCKRVLSRSTSEETTHYDEVNDLKKKFDDPTLSPTEKWRQMRSIEPRNWDQYLRVISNESTCSKRKVKKKRATPKNAVKAKQENTKSSVEKGNAKDSVVKDKNKDGVKIENVEKQQVDGKTDSIAKTVKSTPKKKISEPKGKLTSSRKKTQCVSNSSLSPKQRIQNKGKIMISPSKRKAIERKKLVKRKSSPRLAAIVAAKKSQDNPTAIKNETSMEIDDVPAEQTKLSPKEIKLPPEDIPAQDVPAENVAVDDVPAEEKVKKEIEKIESPPHPPSLPPNVATQIHVTQASLPPASTSATSSAAVINLKANVILKNPSFSNMATLLETPFKLDILSENPNTPRFAIPQPPNEDTPIKSKIPLRSAMKLSHDMFVAHASEIKTPSFPITPGCNSTPPKTVDKMSPGSCNVSRKTDYSSGSSYYRPDEIEEVNERYTYEAISHTLCEGELIIEDHKENIVVVECPGALERVKSFDEKIVPHYTFVQDSNVIVESESSSSSASGGSSSSSSSSSSSASSSSSSTTSSSYIYDDDKDPDFNPNLKSVESEISELMDDSGEIRFPIRNWITPKKVEQTATAPESNHTSLRQTSPPQTQSSSQTIGNKDIIDPDDDEVKNVLEDLEMKRERLKLNLMKDEKKIKSLKSTKRGGLMPRKSRLPPKKRATVNYMPKKTPRKNPTPKKIIRETTVTSAKDVDDLLSILEDTKTPATSSKTTTATDILDEKPSLAIHLKCENTNIVSTTNVNPINSGDEKQPTPAVPMIVVIDDEIKAPPPPSVSKKRGRPPSSRSKVPSPVIQSQKTTTMRTRSGSTLLNSASYDEDIQLKKEFQEVYASSIDDDEKSTQPESAVAHRENEEMLPAMVNETPSSINVDENEEDDDEDDEYEIKTFDDYISVVYDEKSPSSVCKANENVTNAIRNVMTIRLDGHLLRLKATDAMNIFEQIPMTTTMVMNKSDVMKKSSNSRNSNSGTNKRSEKDKVINTVTTKDSKKRTEPSKDKSTTHDDNRLKKNSSDTKAQKEKHDEIKLAAVKIEKPKTLNPVLTESKKVMEKPTWSIKHKTQKYDDVVRPHKNKMDEVERISSTTSTKCTKLKSNDLNSSASKSTTHNVYKQVLAYLHDE